MRSDGGVETSRRTTYATPALLALALLIGAVGCGGGEDVDADSGATVAPPADSSAPTAPAPADESPTPATGTPVFTADTRPDDGGRGSGNGLGLTDVRTARHPGFDRVVFDLEGAGTPGWRVEYVARPAAEGSGEAVPLEGGAFLQVVLRGVGMPYDTGVAPFGDDTTRLSGAGTDGIAQIAPGGVFEGEQQAFIGLTGGERPFRVFALTDPARVVVDVSHG